MILIVLIYILLNAGFAAMLLREKEETESVVSENGGIMLALLPAIIIAGMIRRN